MVDMANVLPTWAVEKSQLYIVDGGHEVLARSYDGGVTWHKKTGRCCHSGSCCRVLIDGVPSLCPYLEEREPGMFYCAFTANNAYGFGTPSDCVRGSGENEPSCPGCTITFEEVS